MALTPEQRQAWVDELRFGGHRQIKGRLREPAWPLSGETEGLCAMGVLNFKVLGGPRDDSLFYEENARMYPVPEEKRGLTPMGRCFVSEMNDHLGMTFWEIADAIAKTPPE
jgi:hypothetical protein